MGSLHDKETLFNEIIQLKRERNDLKEDMKKLKAKMLYQNQQLSRMAQIMQADDSANGKTVSNDIYEITQNGKRRDEEQKSRSLATCLEELEIANKEVPFNSLSLILRFYD